MFFAERLERPAATQFTAAKAKQKNNLEKRGKLSKYDNVDQQMKKLPDASRLHEWQNYLKLDAVKVIDRSTAEEMISHGAEVLPTQWIEVDKDEALRASGKTMEPKMKSRLVARGDLRALFNRSDSPTAYRQAEDQIGRFGPWILTGRKAQQSVVVTTTEGRSAIRLD